MSAINQKNLPDSKKLLMVYIEPTPYVLDLISTLESTLDFQIDVLFLMNNISQQWNLQLKKNQAIFTENLFKAWRQYFIKNKYTAIFLAGWSHPVTLTLLFSAKLFRIPVLMDSDTPLLSNTRTAVYKRLIKRILYPALFKLPTLFLPGGTKQLQYLQYYAVPTKKIILEKMTIDVIAMQHAIARLPTNAHTTLRQQYHLSEDDIVFLFVGRLIERKGIDELIQAFSAIKNSRVKCLIVGDGPLITDVKNAGTHIIYAGRLEKKQIIEAYFLSDIFVLPAHWEPWGLVINEAMAAGKPVITTDQVGCTDDLVIHGKTGLIIKNRSIAALIAAIQYFLDRPEKIKLMSQNALSLIANWTLQDSAKQISIALDAVTFPNSG